MRTVLVLGGGDWNDASVNDLIVPDELNLVECKKEYNDWLGDGHKLAKFRTFTTWLIEFKNCKQAELELYEDD